MIKNLKNKKGFTLIELIVVIAILGILAAIAIPRLTGFQEKAKTSADQATFVTIDKAIQTSVANEVLASVDASTDGTVICTVVAGAITWTGTAKHTGLASVDAAMKAVLGNTPVFKKASHLDIVYTWSISPSGVVTPPAYTP